MTIVTIADTTKDLRLAIDSIFQTYGGVKSLIPDDTTRIFLKPNGIHFTAKSYTDPAMLEALIFF